MKKLSKFKGCLIGGAIGDSLGYPIEFYNIKQIINKYGENGITEYELSGGLARISDDTQMTLFTADGILVGETRACMRGMAAEPEVYIYYSYLNWLNTQMNKKDEKRNNWLTKIAELNVQRAPGNTCLSALKSGKMGTIKKPLNKSKGCGGVMRVAPIGLFYEKAPLKNVGKIGASCNAITHGHPLGNISSSVMAMLIHTIIYGDENYFEKPKERSLEECVDFTIKTECAYKFDKNYMKFSKLMQKAIKLSKQNINDVEAIEELGGGWIAEEAIAIAIYCALKYSDNFEKAIVASVNHSGDSDSTGAITGNILGAYLGIEKIPDKFLEKLELRSLIEEVAEDLYNGCQVSEYGDNSSYEAKKWLSKY